MTVEKKTIRSDIPGHQGYLSGSTAYGHDDCRRMVIGRGITLQGNVADCDALVVEGTVTAEGFQARRMDISEPGVFNGTARVGDAVICGTFDGSLVVTGRLVLRSTAHVRGDISYGAIEVEGGAVIDARVSVVKALEKKPAEQPVQKPTPRVVADNVEKLFDDENEELEQPRTFRRAGQFK